MNNILNFRIKAGILASIFLTSSIFSVNINADDATPHNIIRDAVSTGSKTDIIMGITRESFDFGKIERPGTPLKPMKEDKALQESSQEYANKCIFAHSPEQGYGENLFLGSGSNWSLDDAVLGWAGEVNFYNFEDNSCLPGEMCGHYTQIIWEDSLNVGCAMNMCSTVYDGDGNEIVSGGEPATIIVCQYTDQGNMIGEKPYSLEVPKSIETTNIDINANISNTNIINNSSLDNISLNNTKSESENNLKPNSELEIMLTNLENDSENNSETNNLDNSSLDNTETKSKSENNSKKYSCIKKKHKLSTVQNMFEDEMHKSSMKYIFKKKVLRDFETNADLKSMIKAKVNKRFKKKINDIDEKTMNNWIKFMDTVENIEDNNLDYPSLDEMSQDEIREFFLSLYWVIGEYYLGVYYDYTLDTNAGVFEKAREYCSKN